VLTRVRSAAAGVDERPAVHLGGFAPRHLVHELEIVPEMGAVIATPTVTINAKPQEADSPQVSVMVSGRNSAYESCTRCTADLPGFRSPAIPSQEPGFNDDLGVLGEFLRGPGGFELAPGLSSLPGFTSLNEPIGAVPGFTDASSGGLRRPLIHLAVEEAPRAISGAGEVLGSGEVTVLGRYRGGTEAFVGKPGFKELDLPSNGTGRWYWSRNRAFIDDAITRGDEIRLVTDPHAPLYSGGNVYQRELRYLRDLGYWFEQSGDYWVAVPGR
jgi:hypothetical protein